MKTLRVAVAAATVLLLGGSSGWAHIRVSYALGRIISDSSNVLLMNVEKVDREKNLIVYRKVRDIKGIHPGEVIKHDIGQRGYSAIEWQNVMQSVEVGKSAVMFHNGGVGEICTDRYWYQARAGEWWTMVHDEPIFLLSFTGRPEQLANAVAAMLAGEEAVLPCMAPVQGDWTPLRSRRGKMLRMKASMKLLDYNFNRDFVGWGEQEYRPVADMPGFTHALALGRLGPGAAGIEAGDLNADGKPDICLFTPTKVQVLKNDAGVFTDLSLPIQGGARGAAWADFSGDGKTDLFVAGVGGPRLFLGDGQNLADATARLPSSDYPNFTAVARADFDGDGREDLLLADGFRGLRLFRNANVRTNAAPASKFGPWHYAGPFDNAGNNGFAAVFPPERGVSLAAEYAGKNGEKVVWKQGKFTDGQVNALALFGKPELNSDCAVYLYRELNFGGGVELPASFGSDDTLTVWLNGQLLMAENTSRGCQADQHLMTLKLRPGRNELLLKVCQGQGDFAFYFSASNAPACLPPLFEDVSDAVGLGVAGAAGGVRGDRLAVADVDGDRRPDVLFSAGSGLLLLNRPGGFVLSRDSGIVYETGGVAPAFGDANGDGRPDLFVPQRDKPPKLFVNVGAGKFRDDTAAVPALRSPLGWATAVAWCDLQGTGRPGLLVACLKGPNRYFAGDGKGQFEDAGEGLGLDRRIVNTRGVAALDVNGDQRTDVVFGNEGQDWLVLLGAGSGHAHARR